MVAWLHARNVTVLLTALLVAQLGASCQRGGRVAVPDRSADRARPLVRGEGRALSVLKTLPNGLRVVLQESHSAPVVALQMWVNVGSADEVDAERGLAHVHEHMLFKGTERRGVGEIAAAVEAAGGEINAWTSYDQTVYHLVLASRFLDQGLDILADAMLASSFTSDSLISELEVVLDEIRRSRDMPERVASEQLFDLAYQVHPFRHPIIGSVETVQSFTRSQVLDFYHRWYVPQNMVLVLTGDFRTDEALRSVETLFGGAATRPAPVFARPVEPPQTALRVRIARDDIAEAHLNLAWHIPGLLHDDVPALDLLSVMLGQGESSRLSQEVKRRRAAATEAYAYAYTPLEPGLFVVGAATPPERVEAALRALLEETFRLHHEPVPADELARARRILEMDVIYQKETVEGVARKLGFYLAVAGDLDFEARYLERLARVTPAEVQAVARRYLQSGTLCASLLLPTPAEEHPADHVGRRPERLAPGAGSGGEVGEADEVDEADAADDVEEGAGLEELGPLDETSQAPGAAPSSVVPGAALEGAPEPRLPAAAPAVVYPDEARLGTLVREVEQDIARRYGPVALPAAVHGIVRTVLDNGLVLLIQEDHSVPLVAARVTFLGGQKAEPAAAQGIESLIARLLTRGTSTRSGEELSHRFDQLGGTVGGFSGRNTLGLRAEFHSQHLAEALELFADCLTDPAFPPAEVERERGLALEEIQARDDNLGSLAFRAFAQLLFTDHPYRFDPLGEAETVRRLDRAALQSHWRQRYTPARAILSVVGDVRPDQVAAQVNQLLGGPCPPGEAPPPPQSWKPAESRQVTFRYRDRSQAHIVLGFPGTTVDSPDRFPLDVLSAILSGQGGRLFVELRDRRAMAYSIGAATLEGLDPGYFAVYMATSPERLDEAVAGLLGELQRVREQGVSAAELKRAQEYLIGSYAIGLQRNAERAATLGFNEAYHLGHDAHLRYAGEIQAVTLERVKQIAARYLDLDRYTLAVVKPEQTPGGELTSTPVR